MSKRAANWNLLMTMEMGSSAGGLSQSLPVECAKYLWQRSYGDGWHLVDELLSIFHSAKLELPSFREMMKARNWI